MAGDGVAAGTVSKSQLAVCSGAGRLLRARNSWIFYRLIWRISVIHIQGFFTFKDFRIIYSRYDFRDRITLMFIDSMISLICLIYLYIDYNYTIVSNVSPRNYNVHEYTYIVLLKCTVLFIDFTLDNF
jgi:hypothetical protein